METALPAVETALPAARTAFRKGVIALPNEPTTLLQYCSSVPTTGTALPDVE